MKTTPATAETAIVAPSRPIPLAAGSHVVTIQYHRYGHLVTDPSGLVELSFAPVTHVSFEDGNLRYMVSETKFADEDGTAVIAAFPPGVTFAQAVAELEEHARLTELSIQRCRELEKEDVE